jgi:hypothetical protein
VVHRDVRGVCRIYPMRSEHHKWLEKDHRKHAS